MRADRSPFRTHGCHALRLGRRSIPGQIYFITAVCIHRTPVFRDHRAARAAARSLYTTAWSGDAQPLAWVLMPDHLHLLVQLGECEALTRIIARLKSHMAVNTNAAIDRGGTLWQRGFHDRALRRDEDVGAAARYLLANPVRAGLARTLGDYPYWNAVWLD